MLDENSIPDSPRNIVRWQNSRGTRMLEFSTRSPCETGRRGSRKHVNISTTPALSPAPRSFLSARRRRRRVIRNSACCIPVSDAIWPRAYVAYSIQGITNGQSPAAGRHCRGAKSNGDTRDTRLFLSASFSTPKQATLDRHHHFFSLYLSLSSSLSYIFETAQANLITRKTNRNYIHVIFLEYKLGAV